MKTNLVSICIPAWEYFGHGVELIEKILNTLKNQTNKNFEVIISDQSRDTNIEDFIKSTSFDFYIKHVYFTPGITYVANVNNSIKNANGNIIKPLFQPDFFLTNNAIQDIIDVHTENKKCWCALRHNHCNWESANFYNERVPYYNDRLIVGINTISSPSVISYDSSFSELFDEKLKMLMDCDFYYRLNNHFSLPIILDTECYVTNRVSEKEVKNDPDVIREAKFDLQRVKQKFNLKD
jgi:GTP:adenosylcobinamide-phosphate guanylyltransferase